MKVIEPGHIYSVDSYDGGDPISIRFMKRIGDGYPGNTGLPHSGTNCQELVRVLIDRVSYLNNQIEHVNNESIIEMLGAILYLFEDRAAIRHGIVNLPQYLSQIPHCPICGHVVCHGHQGKQ